MNENEIEKKDTVIKLEYQDFARAWKEGKLLLDFDRRKVQQVVCKMLPMRYRMAHHFWEWVWVLTFPFGITVMIFVKWWVGLIFLLFVPIVLSKATDQSAMQFVIEYALENPEFYWFAVNMDVFRVLPKT